MRLSTCALFLTQLALMLTFVVSNGPAVDTLPLADIKTSTGAHLIPLTRRRPLYWLKVINILKKANENGFNDTAKKLAVLTAKNQAKWAAIGLGAKVAKEQVTGQASEEASTVNGETVEGEKNEQTAKEDSSTSTTESEQATDQASEEASTANSETTEGEKNEQAVKKEDAASTTESEPTESNSWPFCSI